MEVVTAGLGDYVDHGAAGAAELSGVGIGVHLKFLHGIEAELVRRAAGTGAAQGLAEESVVVVGAVHDQRVESAALAGKADVALAHIAGDARS
ncbi:MAG: hypothetical protein HYR58_02600 [Acidobacteria bacterium]|nr:hypothetical protein [Acidobacteriota bacterium]